MIDGMWNYRECRDVHEHQPIFTVWNEVVIVVADRNVFYTQIDLDQAPNLEYEWTVSQLPFDFVFEELTMANSQYYV